MNKNRKQGNAQRMKGKQGRKDSSSKRVNFDNERVSTYEKDMQDRSYPKGAEKTGKCNDVRWYANNPELLRAAASIPFTWTTGTLLPWSNAEGYYEGVPGVQTIYWTPYLGYEEDAIIAASNSIYSYVVHANSRTTQYDPNDLMILILAGAQVFSALALGIKAYGLLRRYDQQDAYTPDAILRTMGFNPEDLHANAAQMWFDLNQLVAQLQQIWIPNTMPLIERWFWLNSYVYRDGQSVKAQYYQFAPTVFYQYDELGSTTGGSLKPIPWMELKATDATPITITYPEGHTWDQYMTIMNDLIQSLLNSQDRGIIFGDILKAYGAERLYSVAPISVDYVVDPVYDVEVLSQIENAVGFGNLFNSTTVPRTVAQGPIVQSPGRTGLQHQLYRASLATATEIPATMNNGSPEEMPLNFHQKESPTPEQIMVATRFRAMGTKVLGFGKVSNVDYAYYGPAACGTELFVWAGVALTMNSASEYDLRIVEPNYYYSGAVSNAVSLTAVEYWATFDWCPMYSFAQSSALTFANSSVNPKTIPEYYSKMYGLLCDYDNYTIQHVSSLKRMHQTAIYSLFGVPSSI